MLSQPWQGKCGQACNNQACHFLVFLFALFLFFFFGERLAYNLSWYGVTLLSGSIAASSGMARRAIAPTLRPIQLWNNCRLQVLVGGSASWTLPWRELKNRRQPPQSEKPEATQNRRQADTSEPPARTTPHQRTNTPHSDGVSGFALFSHCGSSSVAPLQTGGVYFSLYIKFPLGRTENLCHAAPYTYTHLSPRPLSSPAL